MLRKIAATLILATLSACDTSAPASDAGDSPQQQAQPRGEVPVPNGPAQSQAAAQSQPQAPSQGQTQANAGDTTSQARNNRQTIVFVGTSLTAGYGIGAEYAYPALIQARIDSLGLPFRVVNAGLSGETSAGGLSRIDWTLQREVDVLAIELGANDMLRGLSVEQLERNLRQMIDRTRTKYPDADIVILGMEAAPNLGRAYMTAFRGVYREVAEDYDAAYVPFLLEGVATIPELNQEDGIHPTAEGQKLIRETVWKVLEPVLRRRAE